MRPNKLDIAAVGVLCGGLIATAAYVTAVATQPTVDVAPAPAWTEAVVTAPATAYFDPSGDEGWDQAIQAGIDYWTGRDGTTPDVRIVRDRTNLCGKGAAGCAAGYSDGSCRIWIKPQYLKDNRWAVTAIGMHEVGHCFGHDHDDTDLVMHS
jgi:predicted Zn-dependent protease